MSQVTALHRREMILLGAVPTGVTPVMLAVQYKVYVDESEATILVRTALSRVTLGVFIALTRRIAMRAHVHTTKEKKADRHSQGNRWSRRS
jgi:hypothetical protein